MVVELVSNLALLVLPQAAVAALALAHYTAFGAQARRETLMRLWWLGGASGERAGTGVCSVCNGQGLLRLLSQAGDAQPQVRGDERAALATHDADLVCRYGLSRRHASLVRPLGRAQSAGLALDQASCPAWTTASRARVVEA